MISNKVVPEKGGKPDYRQRLKAACLALWTKQGYKQTGIAQLSAKAGISVGGFYSYFETKEALFFEVLQETQQKLIHSTLKTIELTPDKQGVERAIMQVFFEFSQKNMLYDMNCPDYLAFFHKLTAKQQQQITVDSDALFQSAIQQTKLDIKVEQSVAIMSFDILFSGIFKLGDNSKRKGYSDAFQFATRQLINGIFG